MFSIDGVAFDMPASIHRTSNIKSSDLSGDLLDGNYFNDVIGTYVEYEISVAVPVQEEENYAALYEMLTRPVPEHTVRMPYNDGMITFKARIETVSDKLYRADDKRTMWDRNIWRGTTFTVKATRPQKVATWMW